jgi:hypothetical protein
LIILAIYLTPFVPLSFKVEGEDKIEEGLTPLLDSLLLSQIQESHREAKPLLLIPPLPLVKGKEIKGIGLPIKI